jgi:hypothetical protein
LENKDPQVSQLVLALQREADGGISLIVVNQQNGDYYKDKVEKTNEIKGFKDKRKLRHSFSQV